MPAWWFVELPKVEESHHEDPSENPSATEDDEEEQEDQDGSRHRPWNHASCCFPGQCLPGRGAPHPKSTLPGWRRRRSDHSNTLGPRGCRVKCSCERIK